MDIPPNDTSFAVGRYFGIALFLLLMLPLTWGLQAWRASDVVHDVQAYQAEAIAEALSLIEEDFEALQREMLAQARTLAQAPAVVAGLRERARSGAVIGPEPLINFFAEVEPLPQGAAELWDLTPQLVAWQGFSMPMDTAPSSARFLETYQTGLARDDDLRRALVVWWPVQDGAQAVGAVRVMRLVHFEAPVQNQYLRDYSLADVWRRATGLPVQVQYAPLHPAEQPMQGATRLLQGADGTTLARVLVEPPPPEQLIQAVRDRFGHVFAFWATLLMGWLAAGLWRWYRREARRAPREARLGPLVGRFAAVAIAWGGIRYVLLLLDVPARWQRGKAPLAPLFDPTHLASTLGEGLLRSTGDLLLTALFALGFGFLAVDFAARVRDRLWQRRAAPVQPTTGALLQAAVVVMAVVACGTGLITLQALVTRHVVLDSTLDYFVRAGLLPDPLVLVVFCTLLLLMVAVILLATGCIWVGMGLLHRHGVIGLPLWAQWAGGGLAAALALVLCYEAAELQRLVPWPIAVTFLGVAVGAALYGLYRRRRTLDLFILRSVVPTLFLLTVLLYPLLYRGMDAQQQIQMEDVADSFAEGRDPRVLFAIEQVLQIVRSEPEVRSVLQTRAADVVPGTRLDSLATSALRGSLLASLAAYDVSITIFEAQGRPVGRYGDVGQSPDRTVLDEVESIEFEILRQMYEESGSAGAMVEQVTGRREPGRFQYEGIVPLYSAGEAAPLGWVMVRAEPRTLLQDLGTPFPRVLLPSGAYDDLYAEMSIAEFRDGVVVRSIGRDFGRYRIADEVHRALLTQPELWINEQVEERQYRTYYRREEETVRPEVMPPLGPPVSTSVIAVRVPMINTFDHLYYLLRLTVAGFFIGVPLYLLGLYLRWRAGLLPAPRVRFRDKVLNAFMGVGIISVAAVGFVGLRVLTGENERAIQSWLRQHLERVEEALALDARGEEMPYRVLERTRIDSLAARVGLDLNVYRREDLVASSRPQLVRERLIDPRLPVEAYEALYFDGYRFTYTQEQVGSFTYTAGFQALPDEQGRPRYIISVPTLPEQERIEEERARTVAYLFGALLLLVLVVMLTASLLADALARPIARLRSGLQAVAQGRFERMLPVDSRDEIGELVQTFNEMQEQLADSRRKLAQQERQLAWREMARQVAHEIKNPLTPMKLSVQHLRRAFEHDGWHEEQRERFSGLFERITATLIEQIDTLARIANEFHSFARMPSRILERLDLNAVVREAVALMQEEGTVEIETALYAEPLVVEADREELRRIYINLIKNAVQAIPEERAGQITVRTELQQDAEGAWAYSSVADNGTGIGEAARDRIFEPNFSTKTSGTGLGLAIARKSVEDLRGEIGFETEEETGSTFWIRLPLVPD